MTIRGGLLIDNEAIGGGAGASHNNALNSASGGEGDGGGIDVDYGPNLTTILSVLDASDVIFQGNRAVGAPGGTNESSGSGGLGGNAFGGALSTFEGTVTIHHGLLINNQAVGGAGGMGGAAGGTGGTGGNGRGGGIDQRSIQTILGASPRLEVSDVIFEGNRAAGGAGGTGGAGGNGGNGGDAAGGALENLYVSPPTIGPLLVSHSLLLANEAIGGNGGARGAGGARGGAGGLARGGGVLNLVGPAFFSDTVLLGNRAEGGAGASGSNGGDARGGGIYTNSALTLTRSVVVANQAEGGAAEEAGSAGLGQGGGLYILPSFFITVSADPATVILGNHASSSDDDVFGDLM
jgi:hypothetical protein